MSTHQLYFNMIDLSIQKISIYNGFIMKTVILNITDLKCYVFTNFFDMNKFVICEEVLHSDIYYQYTLKQSFQI